jgi:hypothetical protein
MGIAGSRDGHRSESHRNAARAVSHRASPRRAWQPLSAALDTIEPLRGRFRSPNRVSSLAMAFSNERRRSPVILLDSGFFCPNGLRTRSTARSLAGHPFTADPSRFAAADDPTHKAGRRQSPSSSSTGG